MITWISEWEPDGLRVRHLHVLRLPRRKGLGAIRIHQTVIKIFSGTEFFGSFEKNTGTVPSAAKLAKAPSLGACQLVALQSGRSELSLQHPGVMEA